MSAGDQGSSAENSGHLPQFYLVSGLWDKEKGIKLGTVRPIINTVVAVDVGAKVVAELVQDDQGLASSVKGHKESLQVYITDGIGRLCDFDTGKEDDSGEIINQTLKASADVKAISENTKLYFLSRCCGFV